MAYGKPTLRIGLGRSLSRRSLLGGAAGASALALLGGRAASAGQSTPMAFDRDASITSWGFGVEETNPLAFSRVEAFKQAYPSIQLEVVPEFDDQKLLTGVASGNVPDLLWLDRASIATWASRDVLMPMNEFFSSAGIDPASFYEAAINEVTYEGEIYGLPQFMDVRALYLNNTALGEAGADPASLDTGNWDALNELGAQLVKRSGDRVDVWGFDNKMQAGTIYMWGQGNGGVFFNENGEPNFTDPKIVEALQWGVDTYDKQGGYTSYEAVASTWQGDEQFARSQVAMTVYESWMLGIIARVTPDLDFTVQPVRARGGGDPISSTGGPAWAIPNGAGDPEAAQVFIEFMNRDDTWRIGAAAVRDARVSAGQVYIPSLTGKPSADQLQIDEFYEPIAAPFDQAVQLFPQILQTSQLRPFSPLPAGKEVNDIVTDEVQSALRKEESPEDALDSANSKARDAIEGF
jgi:multiple sugar transport system substrate-binding protein